MVFVLAFWSPQFRKSAASRQCSLASADSTANVTHFAFCALLTQVIELPADREEEKKAAEAAVAKTRQQAEAQGQGEQQQSSGLVPVKPESLPQGSKVIVKVEQ